MTLGLYAATQSAPFRGWKSSADRFGVVPRTVETYIDRMAYDILFELLDPELVKFQFQMSTISRGFVAHEYFTKYPGRFNSIHLLDVDLNATLPSGQSGAGARGRGVQTAIGKGSIDWRTTFQAARIGGVKSYFVEQNMELTKEGVAPRDTERLTSAL